MSTFIARNASDEVADLAAGFAVLLVARSLDM